MKQIGDLFSSYAQRLTPPQASVEKVVCKVLSSFSAVPIVDSYISYHPPSRVVYIKAPSVLKSALLQKKPEIMVALKQKLGQKAPVDIR